MENDTLPQNEHKISNLPKALPTNYQPPLTHISNAWNSAIEGIAFHPEDRRVLCDKINDLQDFLISHSARKIFDI